MWANVCAWARATLNCRQRASQWREQKKRSSSCQCHFEFDSQTIPKTHKYRPAKKMCSIIVFILDNFLCKFILFYLFFLFVVDWACARLLNLILFFYRNQRGKNSVFLNNNKRLRTTIVNWSQSRISTLSLGCHRRLPIQLDCECEYTTPSNCVATGNNIQPLCTKEWQRKKCTVEQNEFI